MRPKFSPETSVRNYHRSLRNNAEWRGSHLRSSESVKSRKKATVWWILLKIYIWDVS
jgi:hypothetical protein